jgi:hypothetical protein
MKKRIILAASVIIGALAFSGQSGYAAPQETTAPQSATQAPEAHSWTTEQAITSSVREAWALGGKTEEGFFAIVKVLAQLSAEKRGLTLPDNKEAGIKAGNWIKKEAKKDPDQLLYVIVDRAVQYTAAHPSTGAQQ